MKRISFNTATAEGPRAAHGYRVHLHIGPYTVPFVLQEDVNGAPAILTHWASGYKLHDMRNERLARKVWSGDFTPTTIPQWRMQAQVYVNGLVRAKGAEHVMSKLTSVPVLNV